MGRRAGGSDRVLQLVGVLLGAVLVLGGRAIVTAPAGPAPCVPEVPPQGWSTARAWNEATLAAIRRDLPAPTVHARTCSTCPSRCGTRGRPSTLRRRATSSTRTTPRRTWPPPARRRSATPPTACSSTATATRSARRTRSPPSRPSWPRAATDDLHPHRGRLAGGARQPDRGGGPRRRAHGRCQRGGGYAPPDYEPVNPPLEVAASGTRVVDPNRWQPLQLAEMISQNGIPVEDGVQEFVGPHWGYVEGLRAPAGRPRRAADRPRPAAAARRPRDRPGLPRRGRRGDPVQQPARPGRQPDDRRVAGRDRRQPPRGRRRRRPPREPGDRRRLRPEPRPRGRPVPGARGVLGRRPDSETPPGHWNTIANEVGDQLAPDLRIGGAGPVLDRLEWDVKLYLALNAANHDAAIVAWGARATTTTCVPSR
jgi:hypothetical protein